MCRFFSSHEDRCGVFRPLKTQSRQSGRTSPLASPWQIEPLWCPQNEGDPVTPKVELTRQDYRSGGGMFQERSMAWDPVYSDGCAQHAGLPEDWPQQFTSEEGMKYCKDKSYVTSSLKKHHQFKFKKLYNYDRAINEGQRPDSSPDYRLIPDNEEGILYSRLSQNHIRVIDGNEHNLSANRIYGDHTLQVHGLSDQCINFGIVEHWNERELIIVPGMGSIDGSYTDPIPWSILNDEITQSALILEASSDRLFYTGAFSSLTRYLRAHPFKLDSKIFSCS